MTSQEEVDATVERLRRWAGARDDIRAMLITSTRAIPNAKVDAYSDYDVILIVREVSPYLADTDWLSAFGTVLVAYFDPPARDPDTGVETCGNVTQYENGLKIDFSLWPVAHLTRIVSLPQLPDELAAGYQVLLDKDGLTAALGAPTYRSYIPPRPDEQTYLRLVNDFYVGPPYVAKCLLRGDLLPARWCFDYDMRYVYLLPMLQWRMECDHGWDQKAANLGKGLQDYLPADVWAELESTFAGADTDQNWHALFSMMAVFGRVAREVAASLGFTYPAELELRVTRHVRRMRAGDFAEGPLPAG
jgi:aminoglycoside 6-adenylyltransferase